MCEGFGRVFGETGVCGKKTQCEKTSGSRKCMDWDSAENVNWIFAEIKCLVIKMLFNLFNILFFNLLKIVSLLMSEKTRLTKFHNISVIVIGGGRAIE